jgi:uncharacterized protein YjiS (DUF1127 family)
MPTQQTKPTSEAGRDAAGVGLDFSIALTIAALDGALSEKDAAGPPATSAPSVLSLLRRYWRAFQERRQRRRLRATLHGLSERELMDIGVTSAEIDCIAAHRAFDRLRDGATYWVRT